MNLPPAVTALWGELQQNARLRIGGWVVLLIILSYPILLLSDWKKAIQADYESVAAQKQRLEALAGRQEWVERVDAAKAVSVQMEGRLWNAESRGLAQADFQKWLDKLVKQAKINDARIRVEPAVDIAGHEGVWQTPATIEGPFDQQSFFDLLHAVEANEQLVSVEQLDILHQNKAQKQGRFTLVLKAYFRGRSE
jgi:membrane protein implicated in regulation of membrane protease activity